MNGILRSLSTASNTACPSTPVQVVLPSAFSFRKRSALLDCACLNISSALTLIAVVSSTSITLDPPSQRRGILAPLASLR